MKIFISTLLLSLLISCGAEKPKEPEAAAPGGNKTNDELKAGDEKTGDDKTGDNKKAGEQGDKAEVADCSTLDLTGKWIQQIHKHDDQSVVASETKWDLEKDGEVWIDKIHQEASTLSIELIKETCTLKKNIKNHVPLYQKITKVEAESFIAFNCGRDEKCSSLDTQHTWKKDTSSEQK